MSIYYDGSVDFVGDMKDGAMLTVYSKTGANQMSSYMDNNKLKDLRDKLINYLDAGAPSWENVAKSRMERVIGLTKYSDKLEEENEKLKSELRVYKNIASGIKDERLIPIEMLDLENENERLESIIAETKKVNDYFYYNDGDHCGVTAQICSKIRRALGE